ncbi:hypothetical protein GGF48_001445, partial [Coemansia sp. RSA 921]
KSQATADNTSARKSQGAVYPPPQTRTGPQVLEHEVRGIQNTRPTSRSVQTTQQSARSVQTTQDSPPLHSHSTASDQPPADTEVIDQIVTELVYVHSKLMIVDDRYVIMGSANINDRSMVGNRDSEMAMVVEDTEALITSMDGRPYQAARFAHSLRVQLCQEHCGLLEGFDQLRYINEVFAGNPPIDTTRTSDEDTHVKHGRKAMEDPLSSEFRDVWCSTASTNEHVFRNVFKCVPDNTIETFEQYRKFIPGPSVPHGHAVPGHTVAETLQTLRAVRGQLNCLCL